MEWVITIQDEHVLIHSTRWTAIKVLYLCCRYYPFFTWPFYLWTVIGNHSIEACASMVHAIYGLMIPLPILAQTVILLRTTAFARQKKLVLFIVVPAFLALAAAEMWTFTANIHEATHIFYPFLGETQCIRVQKLRGVGGIDVALRTGYTVLAAFLFDLLCILIVGVHYWRYRPMRGQLLKTFVEQGIYGFFAMSAVNLLASAEYFKPIKHIHGMGMQFAFVLNNIIACRLILNLRRTSSPTLTELDQAQSRLVREALAGIEAGEWQMATRTQLTELEWKAGPGESLGSSDVTGSEPPCPIVTVSGRTG